MAESVSAAESSEKKPVELTMETLVALCKRRGFIFPSSEIYGGINGFFDYGPLGVELRKNIKDAWWQTFVQERDDVVGLDATIIMHPKVWEASGHVANFTDPMVDDKETKLRFRADHLFYAPVKVDGNVIGYVSIMEDEGYEAKAQEMAEAMKRKQAVQGTLEPLELKPFTEASPEEYDLVPSPASGNTGVLTAPRAFNMMFSTYVGAIHDEDNKAYLRPETAQGIFANFKNVVDTGRVKVPFGIAQIGKAFRNEITPRNFIFRSREFEQMEIEYFISPDESLWPTVHREWIDASRAWLKSIGLRDDLLSEDVHPADKLAHYSKACTDIMFRFPFGVQELWGIAARGNYDLTQHGEHSGKSMEYFDEATKSKYIPHVVEPSLGVDRTLLAVLCSAYDEDEIGGEKRNVMRFAPKIAPVKAAIFPLVKNKPELVEKARGLYEGLRKKFNVFWDVSGAIGRRYRRQDEIGTPFGITVDFDTLENDTVTLRDRDTTEQVRLGIGEVKGYIEERVEG